MENFGILSLSYGTGYRTHRSREKIGKTICPIIQLALGEKINRRQFEGRRDRHENSGSQKYDHVTLEKLQTFDHQI